MAGKIPRIGPYSRPTALAKLDGRTRDAQLLERTRSELTQHVGGAPNAVQEALIERIAWLRLHIALLDEKTALVLAKGHREKQDREQTLTAGATLSERDSRQYLAWSNSLARALRDLGAKADAPKPSLRDYLNGRSAAPAAAPAPGEAVS